MPPSMRQIGGAFMATSIQVVFDSLDPDCLAGFWAEALHYVIQPPPAGYASWEAFLEALHVPREEWDSASAIVDPDGKGPRIYIQKMDTPKPGKNRLHLDVNVGGGGKVPFEERKARVDAEVRRLLGLGATRLRVESDEHEYWVVMADPDANEFCLQ
jgi:hypothetical protein